MNTFSYELDRLVDEPNRPGPALDDVLRAGRRRRRNRIIRRAAGGTLAVALGVNGLALALVAASPAETAWSLASSPATMNQEIAELIEAELPAGTRVADLEMEAYGTEEGPDGLPAPIPEREWAEATQWRVTATLDDGHVVSVVLLHAQSETEGDSRANCARDVAEGFSISCEVTDVDVQGQSVETIAQQSALRPSEAAGYWEGVDDPSSVPLEDRHFSHSVEAQPGGDFLISASERFPARDLAAFEAKAHLSEAQLLEIVSSPRLVKAG